MKVVVPLASYHSDSGLSESGKARVERTALGTGGDRVFATLSEATHTIEEAAGTARILGDVSWDRLSVVTSIAHYPRRHLSFHISSLWRSPALFSAWCYKS